MNQRNANAIKTRLATYNQYNGALKLLTRAEPGNALILLDDMTKELIKAVGALKLGFTQDLIDDESGQIIRIFWFGDEMNDYYLCIDEAGLIRAVEADMPNELFDQISHVLNQLY